MFDLNFICKHWNYHVQKDMKTYMDVFFMSLNLSLANVNELKFGLKKS